MFSHPVHNRSGRIPTRDRRGLRRNCERIDERLRVCASNIVKQLADQSAHERAWGLNSSNNLRDDFKPGCHVDGVEPVGHRQADILMSAEFEPQGKHAQGFLEGRFATQSN